MRRIKLTFQAVKTENAWGKVALMMMKSDRGPWPLRPMGFFPHLYIFTLKFKYYVVIFILNFLYFCIIFLLFKSDIKNFIFFKDEDMNNKYLYIKI